MRIGDESRFVNLVDLAKDGNLINAAVGLRHNAKIMREIGKSVIAGSSRSTLDLIIVNSPDVSTCF